MLVCDPIAREGIDYSARTPTSTSEPVSKPAELAGVVAGYDGLVVRSQTKVTAEVIEAATDLRVIGRAGVGVDNIDVDAATRKGVVVVNSPMAVNVAAAEHALALMLALARHIPEADASLRAGRWERGALHRGRASREDARRHRPRATSARSSPGGPPRSRCACSAVDPYVSDEYAKRLGAQLAPLETILHEVGLHQRPRAADARRRKGMIGERELASVEAGRPDHQLRSRRDRSTSEALLEALDDGRVAGAALDVFAQEPPVGNPLVVHPKVVATPHLGASTAEAQVGAAHRGRRAGHRGARAASRRATP